MKLPDWGFLFFRKLPHNFHGQTILDFSEGTLIEATRIDKLDRQRMLTRFGDIRQKLKEAGEDYGDQPDGNGAVTPGSR